VLLDDRRLVLTDVSLGDILTEPYVDSFSLTMMGEKIGCVRRGVGPAMGGTLEA